jgi:hypothetical protein
MAENGPVAAEDMHGIESHELEYDSPVLAEYGSLADLTRSIAGQSGADTTYGLGSAGQNF